MTIATDYLTKLTCAAQKARDHGYVHTGRALEVMLAAERARLKATHGANAFSDTGKAANRLFPGDA